MATRRQRLLQLKKDPNLGLLAIVEDIEKDIRQQNASALQEIKSEAKKAMRESQDPTNVGFVERIVNQAVSRLVADTKGDKGERGIQGEQGIPGLRGERGQVGPPGIKGDDGRQGIQGKQGPAGPQGEKGTPGEPGAKGKDGRDGREIKASEIWKKLSPLKELRAYVTTIASTQAARQRGGGARGGGMGNWITDNFSGDGSTTEFTLTSNVGSGGTAIVVLIQGQVQEQTTHYSVSGKTLTFTTAPINGTAIHAWYVRT